MSWRQNLEPSCVVREDVPAQQQIMYLEQPRRQTWCSFPIEADQVSSLVVFHAAYWKAHLYQETYIILLG